MFKNMTLRTRLLLTGIVLSAVPMLIVSGVVLRQNDQMVTIAANENTKLAKTDLDHIAEGIYAMCQAQQEVIQQTVNASLNVARDNLTTMGTVSLSSETVPWNATNQVSNASQKIDLPKMMVGETWLGNNADSSKPSPLVDKVKKLVGGTCTVFQKMNPAGDMLRVCTNVQKTDGTRAIGTYIPAVGSDGKPNPVVSAVLRGETYHGRAQVVGKWYVTAYEPIFGAGKEVIGMLYVGVPEESAVSLRQAIMKTKVGETGYVYILDSQGQYIISKDGKRDGENIFNAKDAAGNLFIQEIIQKAKALKPGEVAEQLYPWQNQGESTARTKIARIMYFDTWDWIIGVGSYEEEFFRARDQVKAIGRASNWILGGVWLGALLLTTTIWIFVASGISRRIVQVVAQLQEGSSQVSSASQQVSAASQSLAEGATEQAASLEETSSSLEEMSSMTKKNADNAAQANTLAAQARKAADAGSQSMGRMNSAIQEIQKSSNETAKIIKVIDEIAFQTNLLALNAAVEAARAGEAGKGFAVVAEEVRNLAMRSAEAAKNTSALIEESVKNSKNGVDIATEVGKVLNEIVQGISKTSDLVAEIAAASNEQAQGIGQVNAAVSQMDKVTQANAANAEESASASEELSAQAEQMNTIVGTLSSLVGGVSSQRASASAKTNSSKRGPKQAHLLTSDHAFHQIAGGDSNSKTKDKTATASAHSASKHAIPLDDDTEAGFDDFNK
ncbi:MAG: methyl-accepting chemotaxis protein [Phycisphaerae bacterium]|nr:methyl-accepting chemotaxis protein [Phycisphaerae bacterium]